MWGTDFSSRLAGVKTAELPGDKNVSNVTQNPPESGALLAFV